MDAVTLASLERVQALRARLAQREDSEHIQALVRIVLAAATTALLFGMDEGNVAKPDYLELGRAAIVASLLVSLGLFAVIVARPEVSLGRRWFAMVHDAVLLSAALFLGEAALASYAAIYLVMAVANGFRYGTPYLYASTAMSLVGFTLVYATSDYWQSQTTLSINIFVMLAAVPLYVGQLLNSLHHAKDQLRRQASMDPLTQLLNRAELERRVEAVFERKTRGHVFLFCDLDHFKTVNDVAGHAAGDKLLVDVGGIIRRSVRATDLCGRPGGDEFCVLLMNCELDRARAVAEQIRGEVSGYRLAWGQRYFSVGISIGVAPAAAVSDMASLFRLADAACYAAKNAGRNQIHVVDPRIDEVDTANVRLLFLNEEDSGRGAATSARSTQDRAPG